MIIHDVASNNATVRIMMHSGKKGHFLRETTGRFRHPKLHDEPGFACTVLYLQSEFFYAIQQRGSVHPHASGGQCDVAVVFRK